MESGAWSSGRRVRRLLTIGPRGRTIPRVRSIHPVAVPLLVVASAAASACIFFVDEVGGGAGGAGGAGGTGGAETTTLSAGGAGSTSGAGGAGVCTATVEVSGAALVVPGLDGSSELVLSVVGDPLSSSAVFVRLGETIKRFSIAPGNAGPIQPWSESFGSYPGARLASAPDDEVLVTHGGSIFKLVAGINELEQEPSLPLPGGIPSPPTEAVEVGGVVYFRAGISVYRVGQDGPLPTNGPVDRLTANDLGPSWIANSNVVITCLDLACGSRLQSTFPTPAPPFPVFTVSAGAAPRIFLRASSSVDPAFVGPVGERLLRIDQESPLATARSAAFVGERLVVVTATGEVHACCVDGVPSCGPPAPGVEGIGVASSPAGNRAVLAIEEAGLTKLQLITVTP